jgi:hypothetical protein
MTPGNYLYANNALLAAMDAMVGDAVEFGSGERTAVASTSSVPGKDHFNPQTLQEDVVGNNVQAST